MCIRSLGLLTPLEDRYMTSFWVNSFFKAMVVLIISIETTTIFQQHSILSVERILSCVNEFTIPACKNIKLVYFAKVYLFLSEFLHLNESQELHVDEVTALNTSETSSNYKQSINQLTLNIEIYIVVLKSSSQVGCRCTKVQIIQTNEPDSHPVNKM